MGLPPLTTTLPDSSDGRCSGGQRVLTHPAWTPKRGNRWSSFRGQNPPHGVEHSFDATGPCTERHGSSIREHRLRTPPLTSVRALASRGAGGGVCAPSQNRRTDASAHLRHPSTSSSEKSLSPARNLERALPGGDLRRGVAIGERLAGDEREHLPSVVAREPTEPCVVIQDAHISHRPRRPMPEC